MLRPLRGTLSPLGRALGGASSWWLAGGISASACIAAYAPKGASSLAASYTNLANPGTYDAAPGVAPSWSAATGWTFGSTQYLTSGIISDLTWSAIVRYSGLVSTNFEAIFGSYQSGTQAFLIQAHNAGGGALGYYNGGFVAISPMAGNGVIAIAGKTPYRNGTAEVTSIPSGGISPTIPLYLGNCNGVNLPFRGSMQALAIYNATLTAGQVAAVTTAMNAL